MQERVRPTGRRNQRHAIRALLQYACRRGTEIEASRRRRRGRIQIFRPRRLSEFRSPAAEADDLSSITIDRKAEQPVLEAFAVEVEIRDGIQKRVPYSLQMERAIRVADVKAFADQARCQKLSAIAVAPNVQQEIFAFFPDVRSSRHARGF